MLEGLALNIQLWTDGFKNGIDFMIGNNGFIKGPLIAFIAIVIVGFAADTALNIAEKLFGTNRHGTRLNQMAFAGADTVWGSDKETKEMLKFGQYQRLGEKRSTDEYVSIDAEGREQSRLSVTRWSGD
jgi:hypothetical protein